MKQNRSRVQTTRNKIRNRQGGFTLLESFIALSIISIILLMFAPGFKSFFKRMETANGLRTITSALSTARYRAISTNRDMKFTIRDQQVVLLEKNISGWEVWKCLDIDQKVLVSINASPVFYPNGSVAPLCTIFVNSGKEVYNITISIAGRFKISRISI